MNLYLVLYVIKIFKNISILHTKVNIISKISILLSLYIYNIINLLFFF